jgi:O-acetyl-ADP-ribose deacetylase (regulator of RNase III)
MRNKELDELLDWMKEDSVRYRDLKVEEDEQEKKIAVRSLMNIRMPRPVPEHILAVQDAFLQQELDKKGVVSWDQLPTIKEAYGSTHEFADQLSIWQGDITRLAAGAIVNAANSQMLGCFVPCHRCIDNAIHSGAGMQLREECHRQMNQKRIRYGKSYEEPTGQAMVTKGYNLPADHVIHTVGPIVAGRLTDSLRRDLQNCYRSVLQCCVENGIRSVAFCCISTGEFHFPNQEAAKIAVSTVTEFLRENSASFDRIIFDVWKDSDREWYEEELR